MAYSIADQSFDRGKSMGILNVSLNLLRHLAKRPEVTRIHVLGNASLLPALKHLPGTATLALHDEALGGTGRLLWDQWRVYAAARTTGAPWLFLAKGFASAVRECPVRLAAMVYDCLHDYCDRTYPRSFPLLERIYFRHALRATLRKADIIFTISDFTTCEVRRLAAEQGITCPPVRTAGIGLSDDDLLISHLSASRRSRDSIVLTTNPWPYKRADLALEYLARWQVESRYSGRIVVIGGLPPDMTIPAAPKWMHHLRLSHESLGAVMSAARVVVFFSEYEGFGLPPAEGLLAGACPVYSDLPVTREVMQKAGFRFRNGDYASFSAAMDTAFTVDSAQIEAWARDLRSRHSWDLVCERVVQGLLEVQARPEAP